MNFEVEQKFAVADLADLRHRLLQAGVQWKGNVSQADHYFAHPARDFAQTDEALRIRQSDNQTFVTYKGPKIDTTTKTRREIELPLPDGQTVADHWQRLLDALGFTPVACVRKQRQKGTLVWRQTTVDIALDDVDGVGQFVELEREADEESLDAARQQILSLAEHLGLSDAERRSYLEMFLERRSLREPG
jgi:adenylate cyclase, class 2